MFGTFRFLLATMVVAHHLLHWPHGGLGAFAVFAFYLLSGYLITMVLNKTYSWSPAGLARFVSNRALRVYPPYWALAVLSLGVILAFPETAKSLNPRLYLPDDFLEWRSNIVIFGLDLSAKPRFLPPAWSLHVELVYYLLMGIVLSRRLWIVVLWLSGSLGWTVYLIAEGASWGDRFFSVGGASVAFSAGALIWFISSRTTRKLPRWSAGVAFLAFFGHTLFAGGIWDQIRMEGFYASLVLAAVAVFCLKDLRIDGWIKRADQRLGDLSYPVFLGHWPIAVGLTGVLPMLKPGWDLFAAGFAGSVLVALLIHQGVEKPVNNLRDSIRTTRPG